MIYCNCCYSLICFFVSFCDLLSEFCLFFSFEQILFQLYEKFLDRSFEYYLFREIEWD